MVKRCKVYEVTVDGKVIARGFASDVAMVLDCKTQNIVGLGKVEGLYKNKFRIKVIGWKDKFYDRDGELTAISDYIPKVETFVERYGNLDRDGNTIMSKDEYKRHKSLIEDKGYKAKYTKIRHGRSIWSRWYEIFYFQKSDATFKGIQIPR